MPSFISEEAIRIYQKSTTQGLVLTDENIGGMARDGLEALMDRFSMGNIGLIS